MCAPRTYAHPCAADRCRTSERSPRVALFSRTKQIGNTQRNTHPLVQSYNLAAARSRIAFLLFFLRQNSDMEPDGGEEAAAMSSSLPPCPHTLSLDCNLLLPLATSLAGRGSSSPARALSRAWILGGRSYEQRLISSRAPARTSRR